MSRTLSQKLVDRHVELVMAMHGNRWKRSWLPVVWLAVHTLGLGLFLDTLSVAAEADESFDYTRDIEPILQQYCVACHAGAEAEGTLALESYEQLMAGGEHGAVVSAGELKSSRLWLMVSGELEPAMPPANEPQPSSAELEIFRGWIEDGARGPQGAVSGDPLSKLPSIPRRSGHGLPITAVATSADDQVQAFARDGEIILQRGEEELLRIPRTLESIHALQFAEDGQHLIAGGGDSGRRGGGLVIDVDTGEVSRQLIGHQDAVYAVAASPNGKWLATAGYDRQIVIWDLAKGTVAHRLRGHNGAIFTLAFSKDGNVLASGSADDTVKLWRVADGARLDTLSQAQGAIRSLLFSPTGDQLIAGSADRCVRVWNFVSRIEPAINPLVTTRVADQLGIDHIAFVDQGRQLAVISQGRQLKLWAVDGWRLLGLRAELSDQATSVVVNGAGNRLWIGQQDGELVEVPIEPESGSEGPASQASRSDGVPAAAYFNAELKEVEEREGNDGVQQAQRLEGPSSIRGSIEADGDEDWFRFSAEAGQVWVIEVKAARNGSSLDSMAEVRNERGEPLERARFQAIRDTYFTFRGKDSNTSDDFRLFNWEEMELDEYLYANGEIVKLWRYPRGPDSGFMVYPGEGERWTYFDTTPMAHALAEPAYIVRELVEGEPAIANGLPVFSVYYENDDDPRRRYGRDSFLTFTAPRSGTYLIRLRDVRDAPAPGHAMQSHAESHAAPGQSVAQGQSVAAPGQSAQREVPGRLEDEHTEQPNKPYTLLLRPAHPGFRVTIGGFNPAIPQGAGREFKLNLERIDGFEGEVHVNISGLTPGLHAMNPVVIESGQQTAYGLIYADVDATLEGDASIDSSTAPPQVTAVAMIQGSEVSQTVEGLERPRVVPPQGLQIRLRPVSGEQALSIVDQNSGEGSGSKAVSETQLGIPEVWRMFIRPGETVSAEVVIERTGHDNPVSFGNAEAGRNLPYGSYVDNIGLNGLLVMPGHTRRTFFVTASPITKPQQRSFFLRSDQDGGVCSWPIEIEVLKP